MNPVKATKVEDAVASDIPGAYQFKGDSIRCVCPCGCGGFMRLTVFQPPAQEKPGSPSWSWDGNEEAPTLHPSIRDVGGCRFHGHLQAGVWTFCGDSGQGRKAK